MTIMSSTFLTEENKKALLIGVVVIVLVFIYVIIKSKINRRKAADGEDKERVLNILNKVVPDVENYTLAYASWEWSTHQGRTTTTKYWIYGIAFNSERLVVVPLSSAGGDLNHTGIYKIEKSEVHFVNGNMSQTGKKNLAPWVELYDANMKEIISFTVDEENLRDDKFHPVNLLQPEESAAFAEWRNGWVNDINHLTGSEASEVMTKPIKKKKR